MRRFIDCKPFVWTVRAVGYLYLIAILINTVFFYEQYLYHTFFVSEPFGVIAASMANYKINWKEISKPIRYLSICFDIAILLFICWRIVR